MPSFTPQKSNIDTKNDHFKGVHLFQAIILGIHFIKTWNFQEIATTPFDFRPLKILQLQPWSNSIWRKMVFADTHIGLWFIPSLKQNNMPPQKIFLLKRKVVSQPLFFRGFREWDFLVFLISKLVSCISSINTWPRLSEEMNSDCPWHLWWCSDTDGCMVEKGLVN